MTFKTSEQIFDGDYDKDKLWLSKEEYEKRVEELFRNATFGDKLSNKRITKKQAMDRLNIGLINTFWICVSSEDYNKILLEKR